MKQHSIPTTADPGEIGLLLTYMPIIVRAADLPEWERTFCASMIRQHRRGAWHPTEKQTIAMRGIVRRFKENTRDDGPLIEDSNAND